MMLVPPHGSSSLGRPMRNDAPAPRMTTAREFTIIPPVHHLKFGSSRRYSVECFSHSPAFHRPPFFNELRDHAHGDLLRAHRPDIQAHRTRDPVKLFRCRNLLLDKLFAHDARLAPAA